MLESIRKRFETIDLRLGVKTGIAASAALFIANWYDAYLSKPPMLESGLWSVITAIIVMQANVGSTYQAGWLRLLGSIIGTVVGTLSIILLGPSTITLSVGIAMAILTCSFFAMQDAYRIAGLSSAIVILSSLQFSHLNPWLLCFYRLLDSIAGIFAAIFISHIIWPEQVWHDLKEKYIKAVQLARVCYHEVLQTTLNEATYSRDVKNFVAVITSLHSDINDNKLQFLAVETERSYWQGMIQALDRFVETVAILKDVPVEKIYGILDKPLEKQLTVYRDNIDLLFDEIQTSLMESDHRQNNRAPDREHAHRASVSATQLQESEMRLNEELERFRKTHTTHNFPLSDIEQFYSFFYHLHILAQQLRLIATLPTP